MIIKPLSEIKIGEKATIYNINTEQNFKSRLLELGFVNGSQIKFAHKSPTNENIAYEIKGTIIGLRDIDAKNILIEQEV